MLPCMIDIHAHLHDVAYDSDRDKIVRRAFDAGVTKIVTIGTDLEECRKAVACAEKYEGVFASVGIHPEAFREIQYSTSNILPKEKNEVRNLIENLKKIAQSSKKVVAIGECGLDYFSHGVEAAITEEEKALQKEGFLAQIELANELQLPLIIHTRPSLGSMDAYEDMFSILSDSIFDMQPIFILHCYMGDTDVTKRFLELPNVYFSFTGNITYPVKKVLIGTVNDITETVKMIPIERVLAETDCPYLAPVPYRGKRNEPAFVTEVVRQVAQLKGIVYTEAAGQIGRNIEGIFSSLYD